MLIYPTYESLVSIWPVGKIRGARTIQLPADISSKILPIKIPAKRTFIEEPVIYSKPSLRNARLFSDGFRIRPLQSTGGLPIYTTSIRKLRQGYLVGILTKKYLDVIA